MLMTIAISFGLTALLGFAIIPLLRKAKYGQTILDIGPVWHKNKQGTPTMGGFLFIIGIIAAVVVIAVTDYLTNSNLISGNEINGGANKSRFWGGLLMAVGFAVIGFIDDYIKVIKKRNLGLTAKQKTFAQLLITIAYLCTLYMAQSTSMFIPFFGNVHTGIFFWILGIFVVYGGVNAVNLTDGIDGLCSSVTFVVAIAFIVMAAIQRYTGMGILAAALAGGCAGFLVWNWHPAKVFMGDTGSMFLGGLVIALAYGINCPLILIPVGIIYIAEAGSDIIQVSYFKLTHGKRIFKMAPIHHHFEMSGWSEVKIVRVFTTITLIGGIIGAALVYYGR